MNVPWGERLRGISPVAVDGRFYRFVKPDDFQGLLSASPSFTAGGRYNVKGEFGALYFGGSPEVCRQEKLKQVGGNARIMGPQVCGTVRVKAARMLDLTDDRLRKRLRVTRAELTDALDVQIPRSIARAARAAGFHGVKFPSAAMDGVNLAIFDNAISACELEVLGTEPYMAP